MFAHSIYTIGHSNRTANEFLQLLRSQDIQTLVDIRSHPYSRRYPQYSQDSLRAMLEENGITYHLASRHFGGKRKLKNVTRHIAMEKDKLRAFADYMDGEEFKAAAVQLVNLSNKALTVIMCAEKLPEHCHRMLISDYLILHNFDVIHLLDSENTKTHYLSSNARRETQSLIYDRFTAEK